MRAGVGGMVLGNIFSKFVAAKTVLSEELSVPGPQTQFLIWVRSPSFIWQAWIFGNGAPSSFWQGRTLGNEVPELYFVKRGHLQMRSPSSIWQGSTVGN